jgi:predicted nucleotidyltransferase
MESISDSRKGSNAMKTIEEATTISARDRELLTRAKEAILKWIPGATVLVYGSVARGDQTDESDIDILILTDRAVSSDERNNARTSLCDIEIECGTVITAVFQVRAQWHSGPMSGSPFYFNVEREGVLL